MLLNFLWSSHTADEKSSPSIVCSPFFLSGSFYEPPFALRVLRLPRDVTLSLLAVAVVTAPVTGTGCRTSLFRFKFRAAIH